MINVSAWRPVDTVRFPMGTDDPDPAIAADERPSRLVTVGSFSIAVVTVASFARYAAEAENPTTAEQEGSGFTIDRSGSKPKLVPGVTWQRPEGDHSAMPADDDCPVTQVSWFDARAFCHWSGHRLPTEAELVAAIAAEALDGSRPWWCEDWYSPDFFRNEQRVNPAGPTSGTHRVVRGGGARPTSRERRLPDYCDNHLGFAVVAGR